MNRSDSSVSARFAQGLRVLLGLALSVFLVLLSGPARAAGTVKLKSSEASEVSGAWHIFVTIQLPKAPSIAHQPLKFLFTKVAVYERSLVDGKADPVMNKVALQNQQPSFETLDVDFADSSGKIFNQTRFDFGLTRTRGYEAGEYKMLVRTSDGTDIGTSQLIILKGDNPPVDRRSVSFTAPKKSEEKKPAPSTDPAPQMQGDVAPTGTAAPFIPEDAYNKTPEEDIKVKKGGCGCDMKSPTAAAEFGVMLLLCLMAMAAIRRRA